MGAQIGDGEVVLGIAVGAARLEQFVLAVEQVEQAALADVELFAIGIARLLDGKLVLVQVGQLLGQLAGVVEGDGDVLAYVAAGLVAQVLGDVVLFGVLARAGDVGKPLNRFQLRTTSAELDSCCPI
jgi:hypothetical protein